MSNYRSRPSRKARARTRTQIEALEQRQLLSAPGDEVLPGLYHSVATLSQARGFTETVTAGDDAFFIGGTVFNASNSDNRPSSVIDIFNARTGQWSTGQLSQPTLYPSAEAVGQRVVFMTDGNNSASSPTAIDIYDTVSGTWVHHVLPHGSGLSVKAVGDKIAFFGGYLDSAQTRPDPRVFVYDTRLDQWATRTLSVTRSGVAATVVGSRLIFAGGFVVSGNSSVPTDAVDIYDADSDSWSTANLGVPGGNLNAAVVGNKALFAGSSGGQSSTVTDIYDASNGQWSSHTLGGGGSRLG